MSYRYMLYDLNDYVATITLNRPEVRNALNAELMEEMVTALREAKNDDKVRVIVIKGAGDKAFCAGADLGKMGEEDSIIGTRNNFSRYSEIIVSLFEVGKPTIASVQGYALAGGCGLAVACDLTVASENARFGIPEISVGIWGMMITAPISRAIGMKKALELFYTGKHIDAFEAERIGMVNKVVPPDKLKGEVWELAYALAAKSPLAIKLGREAYYNAREMEYLTSLKYLREMITILASTEDAQEGISAFREKRTPTWRGR